MQTMHVFQVLMCSNCSKCVEGFIQVTHPALLLFRKVDYLCFECMHIALLSIFVNADDSAACRDTRRP